MKRNGSLLSDLPDWLPLDAWAGWLEVRKARKIPNTERALRVALLKLDRLRAAGEDPEKVIDQSTERGWTTFYPYRDTAAKPAPIAAAPSVPAKREPEPKGVPMPADVKARIDALVKGTRH